ncbi:MAG TPA: outer membrane protein assembly factor BamC [Gammaproteobacteria bacterium]|nr:outer membrane protein assembly factor BamC [Gammaproteobacteria bacterium]
MNLLKNARIFPLSLLLAVTVAGCGMLPGVDKVLPDRKVEYKKSKQAEKNLEIPPDLTRSSIQDELVIPGAGAPHAATLSQFEKSRPFAGTASVDKGVLPKVENIEVMRDGDQHWLVIKGKPDDIWFQVIEFWQDNGILLEEQDPTVGIIVTGWLENLADISSDFITDTFRRIAGGLYSASTRDQFRVRIENGISPGTTELYLTHRGMQEKIIQDGQGTVERTVWNPREPDPGLEVAMLRRIMVYLGSSDEAAAARLAGAKERQRKPRSRLNQTGDQVSLTVNESFDRSWRLTGVALDRVGFAVEDRNRSEGIYYVRYNDPMRTPEKKGFLSKLVFWNVDEAEIDKESQYWIKLVEGAQATEISVLNAKGVRDNSDTAKRILTLIQEQIR